MSNINVLNKIKRIIMLCTLFTAPLLQAQLANYPLTNGIADQTGNNMDVLLLGDVPPTPPSAGVELCTNGISVIEGGQDVQTPIINNFDLTDFQIEIEFKPTTLPNINEIPYVPVILGGTLGRWLGILIDPDGRVGIKFNDDDNNNIWSNTNVSTGVFHKARISYNNGVTNLFIDDILVMTINLPALIPFQNDFNFSMTDFSSGLTFHGCWRNLVITGSSDIIFSHGFE
jgi:hypothetical protein